MPIECKAFYQKCEDRVSTTCILHICKLFVKQEEATGSEDSAELKGQTYKMGDFVYVEPR